MGSSAASAAAACWAVNTLLGTRLTKQQCVLAGLKSEEAVSGYHADNIGPALLGGFTLIRSLKPLDIIEMTYPQPLHLVLVNPVYECPTAEMRAVLPETVPMQAAIHNSMMSGALTTAILQGNAKRLGECIDSDVIVEPVRAAFIPGFAAVKAAAKKAGAYGCTISGAGPTCVAVVGCSEEGQQVAQAMQDAFIHSGKLQVNSVHMTFEASKSVTLWFKQWHTHTWGGYAATCLVLVVICLIHEALTCYRARFHKLYLAEPEYQPLEPGSARGLETGSARGERATPRLGPASHDPAAKERTFGSGRSWQQAAYSAMYAMNLGLAYLLMLAVMTYNVGLFFIVIFGLAVGNFVFNSGSQLSDVCHAQSS
eukprot:jgi/Astpho2/4198/fgenesh1_pg.00064_%23_19_t